MLCEKCKKKNATTHIHSVVNGVVTELNLCSECAANEGYGSVGQNGLFDMLFSMFGDSVNPGSALAQTRCECCGATFSEIASTGKVGCPACYKLFGEELMPYIKRVHGSTHHTGKKPNRAVMVVSKDDRLSQMRRQLSELIKTERFEDAAVLRDEIKQVEEGQKDE